MAKNTEDRSYTKLAATYPFLQPSKENELRNVDSSLLQYVQKLIANDQIDDEMPRLTEVERELLMSISDE